MNTVFFRGISKKGKTRISENGMVWEVVRECNGRDLPFMKEEHDMVLLRAVITGWMRWIQKENDEHFERII